MTVKEHRIEYIAKRLRTARCSHRLALGLMQVIMIAYSNGDPSMSKKKHTTLSAAAKNKAPSPQAQAFARLALGRTNKAIKAIGLIAQLTGSAYESTPECRKAIVLALKASVQHVEDSFDGSAKASDTFSLPS